MPPPVAAEPVGHEATHLELLQRPDAQSMPLTHDWPLLDRHEPPTSCVAGAGHEHVLVAESHAEPAGTLQTQPCDPYPAIVDVAPLGHAVHGGFPLRRSK